MTGYQEYQPVQSKFFNEYGRCYEDAPNKSGYKLQLKYKIPSTSVCRNNNNKY